MPRGRGHWMTNLQILLVQFQILHQLIFLFGFRVGTSPYTDFFSLPVSSLMIISHDAIFREKLFLNIVLFLSIIFTRWESQCLLYAFVLCSRKFAYKKKILFNLTQININKDFFTLKSIVTEPGLFVLSRSDCMT